MAFWYKGIGIFEGAANANAIDSEVAVGVAFARVVASNDNMEGILSIHNFGNLSFNNLTLQRSCRFQVSRFRFQALEIHLRKVLAVFWELVTDKCKANMDRGFE